MGRLNRYETGAFIAILAAAFLKNVILAGVVPLWQAPDEVSHFEHIQFIAEERSLPVYRLPFSQYSRHLSREVWDSLEATEWGRVAFHGRAIQGFLYDAPHSSGFALPPDFLLHGGSYVQLLPPESNPSRSEFSVYIPKEGTPYGERRNDPANFRNDTLQYSPLYYLAGAGIYRLFYPESLETRVWALRVFSALLIVPFAVFGFLYARLLLNNTMAALSFMAFIAFQPMVSFIFSIINNDVFLLLFSAGAIYFTSHYLLHGGKTAALLAGTMCGLGFVAKPHGLFLIGVWCAVVVARFVGSRKIFWGEAAWGLSPCLLLPLPWVAFNYTQYGSLSGMLGKTVQFLGHMASVPSPWSVLLPLFFRWPFEVFVSFWGNFGWMNIPLPPLASYLMVALSLAGGGAAVKVLVRVLGDRAAWEKTVQVFILSAALVLALDLAFGVLTYNMMSHWGQGRYYFPVWIPMAGTVYFAAKNLLGEAGYERFLIAAPGFMIFFYLFSIYFVLIPRYYL